MPNTFGSSTSVPDGFSLRSETMSTSSGFNRETGVSSGTVNTTLLDFTRCLAALVFEVSVLPTMVGIVWVVVFDDVVVDADVLIICLLASVLFLVLVVLFCVVLEVI